MDRIQLHLAERGKRFLAYLIDIIPITILVLAVFYIFFGFDEVVSKYLDRGDDIQPRIDFLIQRNLIRELSFFIWIAYCIIMEASEKQATFGKTAMGIKVIDEHGNRMSMKQAIKRNTSKILSFVVLSLGFLWILFDKKNQGWHDKINKTFVVDETFQPESVTNYL